MSCENMNGLSTMGAGVARRGPYSPISRANARAGPVVGNSFGFLQLVSNRFLLTFFSLNRNQKKDQIKMKNKVVDRPIRASLRRFILRRVEHWERLIDRGEDLHTAFLMRSVLLGILLRAGYIVRHDKCGCLVVC